MEKNTEIRKRRRGMSLANRKVLRADHNSKNQRGMQHHLLVHLHPKIEESIVVTIHSTPMVHRPNPKAVWHKEVMGVLCVVDVVESTLTSVVTVKQVVSCVVKRVTSWENTLLISKVVKIRATYPNLHCLVHQIGLHREEILLVLTERKVSSMQSLAAKSKRTHHGHDRILYF